MKYKLKKIYPNGPKLGTIINRRVIGEDYWSYDNSRVVLFAKDHPENYPEIWEKVVEKDYEILSYITIKSEIIKYEALDINDDLNCNKYLSIHSIKRLSDSEIFTIGDIIDTRVDNKYKQEILEINLGINDLLLKDKLIFKTKSGYVVSHIAVKVKMPLCTTEDGVDIYLGNKSWILHKNSWYLSPAAIIHNNSNWTPNENEAHWRFSTKEKAEEYILYNKPVLSLNDIQNNSNITIGGIKSLTSLVKSKIQQSV